MPMRSSYEAVVASYHVEDSEDEIDYDDAGLMSRRSPWSHPLIGESHQSFAMNAINSSEDEDDSSGEDLCVICVNKKQGVHAFRPCGHALACLSCCIRLFELSENPICPNCRKPIDSYLSVRLS